ncbi:sulfotransferase domain-containing protein [uncultured Aliiroseovarius sp.]|uniref:sulfotransferase domain-containing protein n=1 Tax=uncultured Aliiroseovarius sp. TaxID=1658783 RepID=UPI00260955DF|nr:sulfotransferase domain-containing protein [uncultured Aliiroseovarius sp.]
MRRTFRKYTDPNDITTVRMSPKTDLAEALPETGPALCVSWDSRFPTQFYDDPRARFFHVIRDPRDVLISGYRYHLKPNHSHEAWLYRARPKFGGASYHQKIAAEPDRISQMLFEMDGKHAGTLNDMMAWPYGHQNVVDLRYEQLIEDHDCARFRAAVEMMNVDGFDTDALVQSYWNNSLFGGISDRANRTRKVKTHVASGAREQWRSKLPREVAEIYAQKYGDALIKLGYATDNKWVDDCLPDAEISL